MTHAHRQLHVLMLGWEYPPLYVGGLGKASQGLARGLAAVGVDVLFVLPNHRPTHPSATLRVTGVRQWLAAATRVEHGRTKRRMKRYAPKGLNFLTVPARLFPYRRVPAGARPGASINVPTDTPAIPGNAGEDNPAGRIYGDDLGAEVARFATRVARLTRRVQADVVHANDWMSFPAAFAAAEPRHLPVFLHIHSTEYDRSGEAVNPAIARIERESCARAAHIFAVSHYTANVLTSRYGVSPGKITVVYNAPDGTTAQSMPALRSAPRAPWVVFLGRLTFQKGPDHFLRAAARVARLNAGARFLVCGSGDMSNDLRTLAQTLGIADRVEFEGFLRPTAVDWVLAHSRVLVMSSVSEPFGLVALEALRNGTPVIVSRQSGVREVLGHSLEADFWDHEKFADEILALLRLPALGRQLVESGREQLEHLSWENAARIILAAYRRVCAALPTALS
ncbi:MAG: glycosyltransferase family 1 protein [Candidimonas sp.]|nr:MAG: glycosyltransferase family 1 protein [Candidimonas sp.]